MRLLGKWSDFNKNLLRSALPARCLFVGYPGWLRLQRSRFHNCRCWTKKVHRWYTMYTIKFRYLTWPTSHSVADLTKYRNAYWFSKLALWKQRWLNFLRRQRYCYLRCWHGDRVLWLINLHLGSSGEVCYYPVDFRHWFHRCSQFRSSRQIARPQNDQWLTLLPSLLSFHSRGVTCRSPLQDSIHITI